MKHEPTDFFIGVADSIYKKDMVFSSCDSAFDEHCVIRRDYYSNLLNKIDKNGIVIYAFKDNEILGYLAFYANDVNTKIAYTTLFAVAKPYQDRHIGTFLMDFCCKLAALKGFKFMELEVRPSNQGAIMFYLNNGFVVDEDAFEDRLYMKKSL